MAVTRLQKVILVAMFLQVKSPCSQANSLPQFIGGAASLFTYSLIHHTSFLNIAIVSQSNHPIIYSNSVDPIR